MTSFTRTTRTRHQGAAVPAPRRGADQPSGLLVLGRYRLHRPLGTGGFGTVWMARDERLEREVAIKILARDRIVDGRFEREARAAARLSHPAIVTLYEAAVDDDGAYLVSELVHGSTLSGLLAAGRLSDRDILEIGIALCDALAHAHSQGVVHRDVKPSNVLIPDRPGSQAAKLTDFGVARVIGADTLTRTGDVVGTAAYMAPEQAEGQEVGVAADLYSLALVLYEALTGVNPVGLGSPARRARRLGAHLPPLRRHRRDLPRELTVLDDALRPRPRDRGALDELRAGLLVSLDRVADDPGTVVAPWPSRSRAPQAAEDRPWAEPEPPAVPRVRWPGRVLAAAGAALATGWLGAVAPGAPAGAPVVAGALAAVAVVLLPRLGWLAAAALVCLLLSAEGLPGAALVTALAGLVPVLLSPRRGSSWPLAAAAAGLGAIRLAGAWPALAGRAPGAWNRLALGGTGWLWTLAAGALAGHGLYTALPSELPANWTGSLSETATHVMPRAFAPGLLAPAVLWGLAALVLPWITRPARPAAIVLVSAWSAGLASGTVTLLRLLHAGTQPPAGDVILGAVAGGILALAPSLVSRDKPSPQSTDTAAGLA